MINLLEFLDVKSIKFSKSNLTNNFLISQAKNDKLKTIDYSENSTKKSRNPILFKDANSLNSADSLYKIIPKNSIDKNNEVSNFQKYIINVKFLQ